MDWYKLGLAVKLGTRFLDRVIDVTSYPTPEIKEWSLSNRPIGNGIMGFADYLLKREIAYGSEEANIELEKILQFIYQTAKIESELLGKEKGVPDYCQKLAEPRRNITLTTVAPTGTVSLIAGCSNGIEPIFSEVTIRNDKTGTYEFDHDLVDKPYFRCAVAANGAKEVTFEEHIKTLASAQKYVDSGVSKTANCPTGTHRDTIAKGFLMAWKLGCKGLAVYRNGSRKLEVLSPKNLKKDKCPVCDSDLLTYGDIKRCSNPTCEFTLKRENE